MLWLISVNYQSIGDIYFGKMEIDICFHLHVKEKIVSLIIIVSFHVPESWLQDIKKHEYVDYINIYRSEL